MVPAFYWVDRRTVPRIWAIKKATHPHILFLYLSPRRASIEMYSLRQAALQSSMWGRMETTQRGFSLHAFIVSSSVTFNYYKNWLFCNIKIISRIVVILLTTQKIHISLNIKLYWVYSLQKRRKMLWYYFNFSLRRERLHDLL